MPNHSLLFADLYKLGASNNKKNCLFKFQGQILRLRSSKGQKGKKKFSCHEFLSKQ